MNLGNILGKAQNFFQKAKSKEGEIKGFIQGLKNKGGNSDVSDMQMLTRSADVSPVVEQQEPNKPNYMIFAVVGVVVLYMLMKKK